MVWNVIKEAMLSKGFAIGSISLLNRILDEGEEIEKLFETSLSQPDGFLFFKRVRDFKKCEDEKSRKIYAADLWYLYFLSFPSY